MSTIANFKRPRVKSDGHLDFIRSLPCCVCGNDIQTEAAHIRTGDLFYGKRPTGMGEKSSDRWAVPLCGAHHREQHNGNERAFWKHHDLNPFLLALVLVACEGDFATALLVLKQHRNSGHD